MDIYRKYISLNFSQQTKNWGVGDISGDFIDNDILGRIVMHTHLETEIKSQKYNNKVLSVAEIW